jgi:hypothetical protein
MEAKTYSISEDRTLSFSRKGSSLILLSHSKSAKKTLKATFSIASISNITNELFLSAEKLIEGFREAIESKGSSSSLSIDQNDVLKYTRKVLSGSTLKDKSFEIKLLGSGNTLEDVGARLDEVEARLDDLETLPVLLKNIEEKLLTKLAAMERKVDELADYHKSYANAAVEKIKKKADVSFNAFSINKEHFSFSNDFKSISKSTDAKHPCLELDKHLSPGMRIDFLIDEIKSDFAFGIVKSQNRDSTNWNNSSLYIYCSTSLESIKLFAQITVKGGDIITLTTKEEKVDFMLNSKKIKTLEIDHVEDYYPYVSIGEKGDKVTITNAVTNELNLIPRA